MASQPPARGAFLHVTAVEKRAPALGRACPERLSRWSKGESSRSLRSIRERRTAVVGAAARPPSGPSRPCARRSTDLGLDGVEVRMREISDRPGRRGGRLRRVADDPDRRRRPRPGRRRGADRPQLPGVSPARRQDQPDSRPRRPARGAASGGRAHGGDAMSVSIGAAGARLRSSQTPTGARGPWPSYRRAPATVVVFTCNHCPYALAWQDRIAQVARDYADRGVRVLAINANDADRYPRDSFEAMKAPGRRARTGRCPTCTTTPRRSRTRTAPR